MLQKTVAEIFVELGILTKEYIEKAQEEALLQNISLESYLLKENKIKEIDLARAYAEKFKLRFLDVITEKMADTELLGKIPLRFLREQAVMPLLIDNQLMLVTSNPQKFQPLDEIAIMLGESLPNIVASRTTILDAINRYYPLEGTKEMIAELGEEKSGNASLDLGAMAQEDILGMEDEAPIIKLVNHILFQAVKQGASDIHIEPFEKEIRVRYRIDGILYPAVIPPKRAQAAIGSRIKIMAGLNIAEKRIPQDGRIQIKVADKAIDIRVSILPVSHGERIVMRLLDKSKTFGKLPNLGFSERDFELLKHIIAQPNGIFLITGPTGSGKTSTLYSILSELNKPEVNIVTVEDPVEYQMTGVGQVQVKEKVGLTFAAALRSILRQDPDIVMIGETRDQETAQIAIQAALTGHFVLSTLHTNSAPATITRLIDMGIEPFLLSSTILGVMAQRLVRKLCPECKQTYNPPVEILKKLGIDSKKAAAMTFYKAVGCEECLSTGYRGRLAIFEIMAMTHAISRLIMERPETSVITVQAIKDGMTQLFEDGLRKVEMGLTTLEEVLSVATSQEENLE